VTRTRNAAVFVSSVLTLAACAGGAGPPPHPGATSRTGSPLCDAPFAPPAGFEPTETFKEAYPDRIGVRLGYADEEGRELHAFAGIPGEFGEGLPDAGTVKLAGGGSGRLSGGPNEVWVVSWEEGGACDPRAVLGSGFDRRAFMAVLEDSGLVASAST
jgi:hypothetical protein